MSQVGVRITTKVPAHGHSGALDGGVLKLTGCKSYQNTSQNLIANSGTYIQFHVEEYDLINGFDLLNPTRFTVPIGYSYASLFCAISIQATANLTHDRIEIHKNRSTAHGRVTVASLDGASYTDKQVFSGPVPVVAGDYFELAYYNIHITTNKATVNGTDRTWVIFNVYR